MVENADNSNAFRSPPRPVDSLVSYVCAGVCYLNFSTAITRSAYHGWFQAKLEERGTLLSAVLSYFLFAKLLRKKKQLFVIKLYSGHSGGCFGAQRRPALAVITKRSIFIRKFFGGGRKEKEGSVNWWSEHDWNAIDACVWQVHRRRLSHLREVECLREVTMPSVRPLDTKKVRIRFQ